MKGQDEAIQSEFDRQELHLRTLYDLSKELFGIVDFEKILKNFLMTTTGNFGVIEAFVLTQDLLSKESNHFESIGFEENEGTLLVEGGGLLLKKWDKKETLLEGNALKGLGFFSPSVVCVLPFMVNETHAGILGLGPKLVGEPYSDQDKELLVTFVNNLVVAVRSAISFEDIKQLNLDMQEKHNQLEEAFNDLDRRVYHLKTLNDVSKDIFGSVDFESILKNFLLMSMGNFGVFEGFILTLEMPSAEIAHFETNGYEEGDLTSLKQGAKQILLNRVDRESNEDLEIITESQDLMPNVACGVCFSMGKSSLGLLGLGPKLIGEPYNEDDKELLITLVNNLVVALKNAISFENIKRLNLNLQEKNAELQAALKKVELLESVKANLSKFVPTTVTKMIEKSPTATIPEAKDQDVSVLFLDIEGYTKLSERLDGAKLNELIEKYFSVFMEAIYSNNGDVNETAGDGLMVIYHSEDETTNALEAVHTALMVREKATLINQENDASSESLLVNMGINSGRALLGAARFDSYTGSRWTYTARGMVTNVAARIGAQATEGGIFLSKITAERIKDQFTLEPMGKFSLKNVSKEVEIFSL